MKLMCYMIKDYAPKLVAASPHRFWMDQFPARHAYRCLPLNIANSHGWELLCPIPLEVEWNGGPLQSDLTVRALKSPPNNLTVEHFARSAFARGIVTFHLEYIFRTEPGWDMVATGPTNHFKDNVQPLTGIIETDWLPYPFAMSWQMLRPGKVVFDEDEPICLIYPIKKQALVDCQPEIHDLEEDPELTKQFVLYRQSREEFLKRYLAGEQDAVKQGWLRHYFTGLLPDGTVAPKDHINRLRLKEPVDLRKSKAKPVIPIEAPLKSAIIGDDAAGLHALARRTDPRWADDSRLNSVEVAPTVRNEAGRRRVDADGRLLGRENVHVFGSQGDAADLDFVVIEDFLSTVECDALCRAFALAQQKGAKSEMNAIWGGEDIASSVLIEAAPETGVILRDAQRRSAQIASLFYRLKCPIYPMQSRLVRTPVGTFIQPRVLDVPADGGPPRGIAAVCCLNDDFEGGELYFTALDIAIKPKRGILVILTDGFQHEFASIRVEKGARLALSVALTFDRTKAEGKRLAKSPA
jgi:hypothetical protein